MTAVPSPLARIMNSAISKMVKYDPNASKKLKPLAGKTIKVNIQPIDQTWVMLVQEDSITISTDQSIEADTTISGKPSALFAMGTNQHIPGLDGVSIQGDASTGQHMAELLKQLEPDWEEAWCDLLGDGPGYQVSQFLKEVGQAGKNLVKSLGISSKEFLLEENRELISPHEMEAFLDDVDDLRADTDRLERQLKELTSKQA